jgi:hypothetical protein
MSTITLTVLGSREVTVNVEPSALREAGPDGVAITYGLYDGPLTVTLTRQEATRLHAMLAAQLRRCCNQDR